MKTIFEHIEYVKGKPHHIRKKVAFGVAGAGASLVAAIWLTSNLMQGVFAIQGSNFADSTAQESAVVYAGDSGTSGLAGVAAAVDAEKVPAHIEIVDVGAPPVKEKKSEQTIIPF